MTEPGATANPARDRAALQAWIAADHALATLLDELRAAAEHDAAHDAGHAVRVAQWTVRLIEEESGAAVDPAAARVAIAAALLHDSVHVPKHHPDRARASERSAAHARERLADLGFAPHEIETAAAAIRDHSFTRGAVPETPLGRALQDADRLEALGAIGIFRLISTGTHMNAQYFHDEDPWADQRELDDKAYSVDHFFKKLLNLPATMCTAAGRNEANRRAHVLREFLSALSQDLAIAPPEERLR